MENMSESDYPRRCNQSSFGNAILTKSDEDMIANFSVAFLLTTTLGLIFNTLSIIVLMVPKKLSSYSFLLIALCVSDSVQLLYHWIFCGFSVFYDFEKGWPRFQFVAGFMLHVAFTSSIYIMVMVSFERYTKTAMPVPVEPPILTKWGRASSMALLVAFSVLFNLPKIWEMEVCEGRWNESSNSTDFGGQLRLQYSNLLESVIYRYSYLIGANILVNWVIPLISLVYLNVGIYQRLKEWKLRRAALKGHHQQDSNNDDWSRTAMLLFIVGFFCICHVWYPLRSIFSILDSHFWYPLQPISSFFNSRFGDRMYTFMYCVNNALNFIIYVVCGRACQGRFKRGLKEVLHCRVRGALSQTQPREER